MSTDLRHSVVLSHFETRKLVAAWKAAKTAAVSSPDLGITSVEVKIGEHGVHWPDGSFLSWEHIRIITTNENTCFRVVDGTPQPIRGYSDFTGRSFGLMPTKTAPAMIVAGFPMHRVKDIDPLSAARLMIDSIAPVRGRVLDTAMGLGYTAIEAAKTALSVVTVELDPVAEEIARVNPWSADLFNNPKITRTAGDVAEKICGFGPGEFDCIIHDPPAQCLAGDLYSGAFYKQACRVLAPTGRMFHYIGDPRSRSGGRTTKGVVKRLMDAGFTKVIPQPKAFGVSAHKHY
jgi:hypothetical protein